MEQILYNQLIYGLRRLENFRTKMTAADATGSAREFCWLFESDWTGEVSHFNLNHLVSFCLHQPTYNTIRYDTIRYDTIRYDTIRYDTIRYDAIRYDTKRYSTIDRKSNKMKGNDTI